MNSTRLGFPESCNEKWMLGVINELLVAYLNFVNKPNTKAKRKIHSKAPSTCNPTLDRLHLSSISRRTTKTTPNITKHKCMKTPAAREGQECSG